MTVMLLGKPAEARRESLNSMPAVTLSPASGGSGQTVTVSGSNLPEKQSGQLSFGGSTAGMPTIQTNASGSFKDSFKILAQPAGPQTVAVWAGTSSATAALTLVGAPTPTPTSTPCATPTSTPAPTPMPTAPTAAWNATKKKEINIPPLWDTVSANIYHFDQAARWAQGVPQQCRLAEAGD
jgi:hypothetical protein